MSNELIKPQTLKGFRDYLPEAMLAREHLMEIARRIYRSYGFSPIDTPALEYAEILLGKGGDESDKQLFRFTDQGDRDVAMRFDLTIPFARFAAQNIGALGTPFKRYHIGTVWRAEKPQKGRYREFMQCDFDSIGTEANASDIETLMVIYDLMEALGFSAFTIRVNHRQLLNGLLDKLGLLEKSTGVLRALDKLPKIGRRMVIDEMTQSVGISAESAEQVLNFAGLSGTPDQILDEVEKLIAGNERGMEGVAKLRELFSVCRQSGLNEQRLALDVSIARGLDYYTGTIYETFLTELPGIGSVCSGGRYDNLAGLFTKEKLPGVGASLGLDRLLAAMEELGLVQNTGIGGQVMIAMFDETRLGDYMRLSRQLRRSGISTEVYPLARKVQKQLQYANRKRFRAAVIAGSQEFERGVWTVKDLESGTQTEVTDAELPAFLHRILSH
ncbi:histidyl-tRNA synthetase [Planctomicrobium piriforme]|uniref:Histidine--tRNA ligase n=1 Tax=Planctomicrobium piriforme TaxID=1576369 RepID=A0A1I3PB83_9PLAN|nr:histidine--tRNA ligase [Planctomicrobium piriforme]SFJ18600.1 histidyl-tRNA synthetase [Planctomicrobium piriforme]